MRTLVEAGMEKVKSGLTTPREVLQHAMAELPLPVVKEKLPEM
jgi:hypothetical protein